MFIVNALKDRCKLLFFLFFCSMSGINAQEPSDRFRDLGLEIQQYPTGFLLGGHFEFGLGQHHALAFRAGVNIFDHRDLGVQEEEKGSGPGFTVGYNYYFNPTHQGWFLGIRNDFWFNSVDWRNNLGSASETSGNTQIVVMQPTAIAGHLFILNNQWVVTPTLAFGYEINVVEEGEDVGEGAILLWGVNLGYRF